MNLEKCFCYYVLIISSSKQVLDTYDGQEVEVICLYICHHLLVFPKKLRQSVPNKAKNWHALLHEQYFCKRRFLDTSQCFRQ